MNKLPKLKYVKYVRSKGKLYAYFDTGQKKAGDKRVWAKLPAPSATGFYDSYLVMMGHRQRRREVVQTVAGLCDEYEKSPEFRKLAMGTQKFYTSTMRRVREQLGKFPIDAVERRHVREVIENRIEGVGSKNAFRAVVGVLYAFARGRDMTRAEPTKDLKQVKTGSHEPWPPEVLEAGLKAEHGRTRLAINLLYYTGQRIGDIVRLRWSDIREGVIYITQQKTGKPMAIPLHSSLRAELDSTARLGEYVICTYEGRQMTDQVVRRELKALAEMFGLELVPHGLRKNAVNALLEAGATVPEVGAITGQSFNMVEHYARRVSVKRLSQAAMDKFENATGKFKPSNKLGDETA